MNPLARLRRLWDGLTQRERRLAMTGLLVLVPVVGYLYLWQPLVAKWGRLQHEVARLDAQMRQLKADLAQIERLRLLPASHRAPLEMLLAQAPVGARIDRIGPQRAELHWEEVEAGAWLAWLAASASRGLHIERCELTPVAPGRLTVHMTVMSAS